MKSTSSKTVLQLVLMVCGTSTVISKHNVTTACSCYRFYNQNKTWTESEDNCTGDGGHLVTMETEKEWTFINSEIQRRSTYLNEWRIGLKNESNEWKWANNKSLTIHYKWQPGQPSHDGKCVVMAKNYPTSSRGLWNDLSCSIRKGFICEYEKVLESECSYSGTFCLPHQINQSSTERPITNKTCASSNPDPELLYVVIALGILLAGGIGFYIYVFYCKDSGNAGILLRCKKYRRCKFKARASVQMEDGRAPLQTDPTIEAEIEDDRNKPDMENSAGLGNPVAQEDTVENSVNPENTSQDPTSSTSAYAVLYSCVNIEQKSPEENEDPAPPKMPSPYRKAPGEPVVYATIDKSKKNDKGRGSNVEVVYAAVDKKQKRRNTKGNS